VTETEQRPRYYEGQYLGAADLTAAVDYARSQLSRALLAAHRWGIALGLDLVEVPGPNNTLDVFVNPGYAWDGFGRPLLAGTPYKLPVSLFSQYDAVGGANPVAVPVWLAYDETLTSPPAHGFQSCDSTSAYARVLESFRVEVGPRAAISSQRDPVEIGAQTMDAAQALIAFDSTAATVVDLDVPQQSLPVDSTAEWLVPLGYVLYQPGSPGSFVTRDAATTTLSQNSRRYCGAVAGSIEANGGHVTVHDRTKDYSTDVTDDLLWVEGTLRADDDVRIYGHHALAFIGTYNESPRLPYEVTRTDDPGSGSSSLRLVIGNASAGDNKLTVGPMPSAGTYTEQLVITDDGRVGIRVSDPHAPLHLPSDGVQVGDSGVVTENFYAQANKDGGTSGLRIYDGDARLGGTHVATFTSDGKLGIGTTSPTAPVHVASIDGIRQGSLYLHGDESHSSLSFNSHHGPGNSGWVFDDPGKPTVTLEMDDYFGWPRFEVYASPQNNNQTFARRLSLNGHTGNLVIGTSGGGYLGVGVDPPTAPVDVYGDVQATGEIRAGDLRATGSVFTGQYVSSGITSAYIAAAARVPVQVIGGMVEYTGAQLSGFGFSCAKDASAAAGFYWIYFDVPFSTVPAVVATPIFGQWQTKENVNLRLGILVDQVTLTSARIVTSDSTHTINPYAFSFIAIGGRA
jgi:hypothetical protein